MSLDKSTMWGEIRLNTEDRNYKFLEVAAGQYDFRVLNKEKEIRCSMHETEQEYGKDIWVGLPYSTWDFFNELKDDSKCFVVLVDKHDSNVIYLPINKISKRYKFGYGTGLSFTLERIGEMYRIKGDPSSCLNEYTNKMEKLFEPL